MSVKTFSDFPYYMLHDYFSELMKHYNIVDDEQDDVIQIYNDITFEEPWLDFHSNEDYLDFGSYYNKKESSVTKIRLRGPRTNIVTGGGEYTDVYAKIENYGYKPIGIRPTLTEDWINENWFNFDKNEYNPYKSGLFTLDEILEILKENIKEVKKTTLSTNINKKKYVGELISNDYCAIEHISSNDEELKTIFDENRGSILNNKIDIFKSKPGKSFSLKKWKRKLVSEDIKIEAENEIYLRKDSFFYKWFEKNLKTLGDSKTDNGLRLLSNNEKQNSEYFTWNHEHYINDNKLFNFIGCIWQSWPHEDKWKIFHRSLKDFMIDAIPTNNMGINLKTFIWEHFDRIYQEVYNMEKNIYSLLDPEETYIKFLGYLSLFYGINIDSLSAISEKNQRWYVKNLPHFLKKKGTWSSILISWQCIIDKDNEVKLYERWHLKNKITNETSIDINELEVIDV